MYDIALSASACLRSGTRACVAWMVSPAASDEALVLTPGGGRIGTLASGAFDGLLADVAARNLPTGRYVRHAVSEVESALCGLPAGTPVAFLVVPADQFPADLWPWLLGRQAVVITALVDDVDVTSVTVEPSSAAGDDAHAVSEPGSADAEVSAEPVVTSLVPVTRLVIAGAGPMAEALADQGRLLGWRVTAQSRPDLVAGLTATLSWLDAVVVMGHDVEASSRCLMAALDSEAGYVGALGSRAMQQSRADWLAYRDVTDLSRVRGPAGLDIHARTPAEVAVSIAAQIIAELGR